MTEQHIDPETQRLLDELEHPTEREHLEARATELGVKFRGNTGDDTLRDRIAEAEAALTEPVPADVEAQTDEAFTVRNVSKNRRRIQCVELAVGESYTLTERDLADERLMAKVHRAIDLGVLVRVAN